MGKTFEGEGASYVFLLDPDSETAIGTKAAPLYTDSRWLPRLLYSETDNDSYKHFTVPLGEIYHILFVWIELTTTATAGARQLVVEFQDDASDVIGQIRVGATQAASLTQYYMVASSLADLTAVRDTDYLMTPLPSGAILDAGYRVVVYDNANVDRWADDMNVQMKVMWRPTP